jgi:RHS repeat-associated protein
MTTTAPNLNVTTNSYDALTRLTQVSDSIGLVSRYTYDAAGNRLSQADGNGNTTTYGYDALDRVITVRDPLGKTTSSQYDAVGNLLKSTDRNSHATTYTYDAINRRTSATDALSNTTQSQYDAVGNLTRLTDANSHATQYAYDAVNRPAQETYADGKTRSFTYDGVGNVLTRTDQIGHVTSYTYNDLYFLIARSYPSAINDSFTYDLSGRVLGAQRGSWPVTFTYDGANRVTQTVQNGHTVSYSYNVPGRTRVVTYPGGRVITEHTDARARLARTDDGSSPPPIVQYTYDLGNRVTTRGYRNGTLSTYTYNADNWILSLEHSFGATRVAGFGYTYDNEGNKKFEQKRHDTTHSEGYQYDNTDRLITYQVGTLVGSTVPVPSTQTSYNLDPVGNWNSKTTNAVTQNRVHDAVNELIQIDATKLTYDADGNLQNDATYTYAYDEENRLTNVTRNSDSAVVGQYQYDALGRRVQKIANPAGAPATAVYLYDSARIIEEQDSLNATQATYVYGNYIDEVLTMDRSGHPYYYHQNALWSVEAVTNSIAVPVERYAYDAYGFVSVTDGAGNPVPANSWGAAHSVIANPYLFTGRQLDEETGLSCYRARYYHPAEGRFVIRDPLGYVDGTNLYEYVGDRPTRMTDALGTTFTVKYSQSDFKSSGYALDFTILDPCCTGYNIMQIVRTADISGSFLQLIGVNIGFGNWNVDDGRYLGGSSPSASPPYIDNHVPAMRGGSTIVAMTDNPGNQWNRTAYEFEVCALCVAGSSAGQIYGCQKWYAIASGLFGDATHRAGGSSATPSADWTTLAAKNIPIPTFTTPAACPPLPTSSCTTGSTASTTGTGSSSQNKY